MKINMGIGDIMVILLKKKVENKEVGDQEKPFSPWERGHRTSPFISLSSDI